MSTTAPAAADRPWSVADIEPVVCDLKATVGILGHLITTNSSSNNEVNDDAWRKVESDLISLADRADELWHTVWQQRCDEQRAHEVALAAARAEKAAPGSPEDVEERQVYVPDGSRRDGAMPDLLQRNRGAGKGGGACDTAEGCQQKGDPPQGRAPCAPAIGGRAAMKPPVGHGKAVTLSEVTGIADRFWIDLDALAARAEPDQRATVITLGIAAVGQCLCDRAQALLMAAVKVQAEHLAAAQPKPHPQSAKPPT